MKHNIVLALPNDRGVAGLPRDGFGVWRVEFCRGWLSRVRFIFDRCVMVPQEAEGCSRDVLQQDRLAAAEALGRV